MLLKKVGATVAQRVRAMTLGSLMLASSPAVSEKVSQQPADCRGFPRTLPTIMLAAIV